MGIESNRTYYIPGLYIWVHTTGFYLVNPL